MAVNVIGNQLVKLYSSEDFNTRNDKCTWDTRQYCQVVREEQTTMFQVQVTPQTGDDILTNGDFSNGTTSWNPPIGDGIGIVQDGRYILSPNTIAGMLVSQNVTVAANSYYCIEFNVDSIFGDCTLGAVGISYAAPAGYSFTTTGTHRLYFKSGASTSATLTFSVTNTNDPGCGPIVNSAIWYDYFTMTLLTTPVVTIEDLSGVTKRTLTPFAQEQDRINYAIDWLGLTTETSYRVCITGVDDLDFNFLDYGLALGTEGGAAIELEEGGFLKWYG